MNHDENEEEQDDSDFFRSNPDPLAAAKQEEATKERMRNYIMKKGGFEADEVDTLCPDDAALKAFYEDMRKMHPKKGDPNEDHLDEGETDAAPEEDEMPLSKEDEDHAKALEGEKRKAIDKTAKRQETAAKRDFLRAGAHLPPDERPKPADYDSFMAGLGDLDTVDTDAPIDDKAVKKNGKKKKK